MDASQPPSGFKKGLTQYGDSGFSLFLRKAFIKGAGYTDDALARPVIGIASTGSAYNPCHGNMPQLLEAVTRGIQLAGGLPMPFPTISLHESFASPTSMFLRNLMSMDTEEMIRAQPMDAVVLIGGCDKTVPAQLMGAASANLPAIQLITGSMLTGSHRSQRVGACTDCRRYWAMYRSETIDGEEIAEVNNALVASVGTCSVMGTASTMACLAEAMGLTVPGGASPPAVTADRMRVAEQTGQQAVWLARQGLRVADILDERALENGMRVLLAIGGSTNAIVHLAAIAGRLGFELDLKALDRMGRETPVLLDLKPSGEHYMEDFHAAGGMTTSMASTAASKPATPSTVASSIKSPKAGAAFALLARLTALAAVVALGAGCGTGAPLEPPAIGPARAVSLAGEALPEGERPGWLLNLTNDGWFGESAQQFQHAAHSVFRAVENRRPVIRCTNNGLTCYVDEAGFLHDLGVGAAADVYGPGFRVVKLAVPASPREPTFYQRHGNWFGWGCVFLALGWVLVDQLRRQLRPQS
mgnify:CR=1 FL=1